MRLNGGGWFCDTVAALGLMQFTLSSVHPVIEVAVPTTARVDMRSRRRGASREQVVDLVVQAPSDYAGGIPGSKYIRPWIVESAIETPQSPERMTEVDK
ncbi:hypothetical protein BKA83DRAFT_4288747 [Pisolithus microcarpus]|nr:hypothetical protein BKA83DRAFT_4288747 [Pisolithus microcarpus]